MKSPLMEWLDKGKKYNVEGKLEWTGSVVPVEINGWKVVGVSYNLKPILVKDDIVIMMNLN